MVGARGRDKDRETAEGWRQIDGWRETENAQEINSHLYGRSGEG